MPLTASLPRRLAVIGIIVGFGFMAASWYVYKYLSLIHICKAYGEIGYINFTSVPDTRFDDQERLIYLGIDMDEGKQFRIGSISFSGLDETAQHEASQDFPLRPRQVYNQKVWELFLMGHNPLLDSCSSERQLDERAGRVTISLNCGQRPIE